MAVRKRVSARRGLMQLTARQHCFRIVVWAIPISVRSAPPSGAVAGILISAAILLLEFVVFGRTLARALLTQAVEMEVADFLGRYADLKTKAGHQRVVLEVGVAAEIIQAKLHPLSS
jgi:hypothetical protein